MLVDQVQRLIDAYVDQLPEASRRSAFGFPCYFARDKVFGLYDGYALVLKFDKSTGDELLALAVGQRFRHARNTFGRAWIRINPGRVQSTEVLETLIVQSYNYVLASLE
jgi:hypothetical protein